jgi:large subunit ribosomal protein L21
MYAIIRSGGKQYKVAPGDKVRMALSQAEVNSTVEFPEVLAVDEGAGLRVGTPLIESAKVTAKVLAHGRDRKIIVFRFTRRKGYRRKLGHRQDFTEVQIENIAVAS